MTTDNSRYEAVAKAHFDAIGRPDDGNEMRAWIAGASFAEKQGWNAAIDKAIDLAYNSGLGDFAVEIGKLKI